MPCHVYFCLAKKPRLLFLPPAFLPRLPAFTFSCATLFTHSTPCHAMLMLCTLLPCLPLGRMSAGIEFQRSGHSTCCRAHAIRHAAMSAAAPYAMPCRRHILPALFIECFAMESCCCVLLFCCHLPVWLMSFAGACCCQVQALCMPPCHQRSRESFSGMPVSWDMRLMRYKMNGENAGRRACHAMLLVYIHAMAMLRCRCQVLPGQLSFTMPRKASATACPPRLMPACLF